MRSFILWMAVFLLLPVTAVAATPQGYLSDDSVALLRGATTTGQRVVLDDVPLLGAPQTLELERFDVFAPEAKIILRHESGETTLPVPATRYFRGVVAGIRGSLAVIALDDDLRGLVVANDRTFSIKRDERPGRPAGSSEFLVTEFDAEADAPEGMEPFVCGVDGEGELSARELLAPIAPQTTTGGSPVYHLNLAVEADYEMRVIKGSVDDTISYVGDLVAATSAIYDRDISTDLTIGVLYTYDTNNDPWTQTSSINALYELRDYYNANRRSVHRSAVMMVSGKGLGGGVAWLSQACRGNYTGGNALHYGVIGNMTGGVNDKDPTLPTYWDVLGFAHELGHLVGSLHTHCIESTGYGRPYVDLCYNGEGGCYAGTQSVPPELGTLMSYCHLRAGGMTNTRMLFGQAGEASEAVLPPMRNYIDGYTPSGTITAPASVVPGQGGYVASVPNVAGLTYAWSISNGSITAGQGTSQITFTAGAAGTMSVTVGVHAVTGCGVTNSRSIVVLPPCDPLTPVASSNSPVCEGGTLDLTVDTEGTSYAWTGPNGFTSSQRSPSIASVTPAAAGQYNVTVTLANGCSYGASTIVAVTSPPAATVISAPESVCAYASGNVASVPAQTGVTYAWSISGGSIAAGQGTASITFTAGESGSVDLGVTVTNSCGSVTDDATIAIAPPPPFPSIDAPSSVCPEGSGTASINLPAGATVVWSVVNGTLDSGQGTDTITFTAVMTGNVEITATLTNGCGSVPSTIYIPIADLPGPAYLVAPTSVAVSSSGNVASAQPVAGVIYSWSITGGTITAGQGTDSIEFSAGSPGTTMEITVTKTFVDSGCIHSFGYRRVSVDFLDVQPPNPLREFVNTIARNGVTGGCGGGNYCPGSSVTRAQMAVFLLTSKEFGGYAPPAATGSMFGDVPANSFAAAWIEELARRGVTAGCGGGNYCPSSPVNREQMSVFLLLTKEGSGYVPPGAVGIFGDVPASNGFAKWIEELYVRGITGGCSSTPLLYCPRNAVTRGQMAVFLTTTFGLE